MQVAMETPSTEHGGLGCTDGSTCTPLSAGVPAAAVRHDADAQPVRQRGEQRVRGPGGGARSGPRGQPWRALRPL